MTDLVDLGEGFLRQPFWLHSEASKLLCQALPHHAIATLHLRVGMLKRDLPGGCSKLAVLLFVMQLQITEDNSTLAW